MDFEAKRDSSKMHLKRLAGCIGGEMGEIKENILVVLNQYAAGAQASPHSEDECYWYHPDHLGSASWVSDKAGKGIQHLYYLPWGEELDNQRATDYASRYTFSGKERDMETGYGYFGARYYDSDLNIWLSVDPLADKYPGLSPYTYCANNPVKLVDPDGRDFEVVVDDNPENPTITIRANYIVYGSDSEYQQAKAAIDSWNRQSGKYVIETDDAKYTVNIELSIERVNDKNMLVKNSHIDNTIDFVDKLKSKNPLARGEAIPILNGGMYQIQILKNSSCKQIIMHEIGHTLGLAHSTGLMYPNGYYQYEDIYIRHIGGIINYAGFDIDIGKDDIITEHGPNKSVQAKDYFKGKIIWKE